jgi:mitogen-activated protein kinase 1/3
VGCILAELVGRKPIFPGRDSFHQITLIISVLGTPPPADPARGERLNDNKNSSGPTDDYIMNLPKKPKIPFRQFYPKASALACDLIDKLLTFEPEERLTVEEALKHPYLEELHCEEDEPVAPAFDFSDFYFEYVKTSKEDLKVLITQEILNNHPEEQWEPPQLAADNTQNLNNTQEKNSLENFTKDLGKNLPKSVKKQRRKSF